MTTDEKIIERVRKLMALATSSNEHEAAAAAAKAQELLLKYNLSVNALEEKPKAGESHFDDHDSYSIGWRSDLIAVICANACGGLVQMTIRTHRFAKRFWVFGEPANVEVATYLYHYLTKELLRIGPKPAASKAGHAFRLGAVAAIGHRLRETFTEFRQASAETQSLVLVKDAAAIEARNAYFPKLGTGRRSGTEDWASFAKGVEAGKNIPLRRGVSSTNAGGQTLLK